MSDCGSARPASSTWRNHNVVLTLIVRAADGLAAGIWNGATLAAYIYIIQNHSNKSVGIAEGIFGTFCAASGIPAGWFADRMRRDRTLRFCGFIMLAAIAATATALFLPHHHLSWRGIDVDSRFAVLLGAMVLWGVAEGYSPVLDAIFADSVPTGGRVGIYTMAFTVYVCASSCGQFIAAALFYASGNKWEVHTLALVILAGMVVALIPGVALGMFDDDKTLGEESEALLSGSLDEEVDGEAGAQGRKRKPLNSWTSINFLLPAVLLASDAVFGLAAGMTVKFFPLFFMGKVHLSPATTNIVMASIPLVLAPLSFLAQRIGGCIGRVPTIIFFESIGVSMMAVVGVWPALWPQAMLVVPMIILRSAANNCCYALEKSLLMDYVRKESRGRWNSLDSVLAFGWCGSAVAGGFLLDRYGFDITFIITASAQGFAVLMLIPLLFIVPKGDGAQSSSTRAGVAAVVLTPAAENGDAPLPNGTACQNGTSLHNGEMAAGFSEAAAHAAGENMLTAPLLTPVVGTRPSLERDRMLDDVRIGSYEQHRIRVAPE